MKSVSVVEFRRGEDGLPDSLTEIARHHATCWGTAVANIGQEEWLESDAEGNLLVLHRVINGVAEEDQQKLEVTSKIRLGEMVNRICSIKVPISSDAIVAPRAFLATVSILPLAWRSLSLTELQVDGSIYLFAVICPRYQNLLMRLQTNIARVIDSLGHISFDKYRAYKTGAQEDEEPFRFVDGELIEQFLDCTETTQEELVEGLEVNVDEVRAMIEELRRLH